MCGIAGLLSRDHRAAILPMTEALLHRGPDGDGYFEDDMIALGQRRLSIIDIAGGRQPMSDESRTLQLVCNGEIYNSPELRRALERRGHVFRTGSDVEVILHLYQDHGPACVDHLRGMFAFALWDRERRLLLLARDHMGQKPLFFVEDGHDLYFASEVGAILKSGLVQPEIDLDGIWHYVSLRFMPERYSCFRRIQKLPAATRLVWQDGKVSLERYWQPDFKQKLPKDERVILDDLDRLLRDTVEMHLLSDVRVGAFVSGGIDSSTVAAMMAAVSKEPIPAFSIGVEEQSFDELPYARLVTARYGMEAHESVVRADVVRMLPSMIEHMGEPIDPFGFGVYLTAELAAKHVKVVLGGDGGDENFAGYDRFVGQYLLDYYATLPVWFRRQVMQRLVQRIPNSFSYKSLAQKAAWMNQLSFFARGARYVESMSFLRFSQEAKERLFTPAARACIADPDSARKLLDFFEAENAADMVDKMLYSELMTRAPDHHLAIADRMCMAHSLECRSPLIDHRVVEFAAAIPSELKLKGYRLKYLLRRVAERYLPRELITRRKQGFAFPIGMWMRGELRGFATRLLAESRFVELGLFERSYVERLREEHFAGRVDHSYRLWILLNLELWHRVHLEGEAAAGEQGFAA